MVKNNNNHESISDIINCEYLETEYPQQYIEESGIIEEILEVVFDNIKDNLKKNFKQKEIITELKNNSELIEKLVNISDRLLKIIDIEYGDLKIDNTKEKKINNFWNLNK